MIRYWLRVIMLALLLAACPGRHAPGDDLPDNRPVLAAIPGTPTIDGRIDDAWNNAPEVVTTKPVVESTHLKPGQAASAARIKALWDRDSLYLLFQVHDDKISTTSGAPWERDSVEILIDENASRSRTFEPDDSQYRIAATGEVTCGDGDDPKLIQAAVVKTDDGYLVETRLRLRTGQCVAGQRMGLELQVNNDPGVGARGSTMKWHDVTDASWRDTSGFGTLLLSPSVDNARSAMQENPDVPEDLAALGRDIQKQSVASRTVETEAEVAARVPDWVQDAVFYQIFPERFRNGDPGNDPTRPSLEFPEIVPDNWHVTNWTRQWYARDAWEKEMGPDFYEDGVFHRRYGGDLQGIIDQLDYIADLGITAIYLNPVFYARSLHKYDGNSFHHIDPHFGPDPKGDFAIMATESSDPKTWQWTRADRLFLELIQQAHKRDLRIIIDGVFNHTGRDFFAFADLRKHQKASPYKDWYVVTSFASTDNNGKTTGAFTYEGWWGVDTLPVFADSKDGNDLHPGPKEYILNATRRWMDPDGNGDPTDGIDGWRLDVANEVPNGFWKDWNRLVRELNPQAYTTAEIWGDAGEYLRDCGFSSTMNYHGFAYPSKGFLIDGRIGAEQFRRMLVERMESHSPRVQYALLNLIDSHDTDRVASMIVNGAHRRAYQKPERFDYDVGDRVSPRAFPEYDIAPENPQQTKIHRLLTLFQMTFPGAPMVYYGTEAGMDGADDPDDRMPMIWPDLEYEARNVGPDGKPRPETPVAFNQQMHRFYQDAVALRHRHRSLKRGDFQPLDSPAPMVFLFTRTLGDQTLLVALNRGDRDVTIANPGSAEISRLLFSTARSENGADDEQTQTTTKQWQLPGLTGCVWEITDSTHHRASGTPNKP